jgi:hypothetical protein
MNFNRQNIITGNQRGRGHVGNEIISGFPGTASQGACVNRPCRHVDASGFAAVEIKHRAIVQEVTGG